MSSLIIKGLTYAYSDAVCTLDAVDVHLTLGWTGIVGANGSGKTTLLRLIEGQLKPRSGHVSVRPPGRIHRCPQRVSYTDDIADFCWDWDKLAQRLRGRLGLEPPQLERWNTLSPGERKRWQIGAALAAQPAVLLLDEPTNHLDREGRDLLLQSLRGFRGIGLVVSHDRTLLDELTEGTLRLRGTADHFPGPYSEAAAHWALQDRQVFDDWERRSIEEKRLQKRLADKRRARHEAERKMSSRYRMKGPKDSEARSTAAKARAAHGEARLSQAVRKVRGQLERHREEVRPDLPRTLGRSVFVNFQTSRRNPVFQLQTSELKAGDHAVLQDVDVAVERTDRIRLAGANGAGKTTLLEALATADGLYLPQELESAGELLAAVRSRPVEERGRILQIVAALGVDPARLLSSEAPSPGEARKLALADALGRHVPALLLDEPTNHLDLPSIERLEATLRAYPGALLLVSHDDAFAAAVTDVTWRIEGKRVRVE